MNLKSPKFKDSFSQLIATPSVSCLNPKLDQGNRAVIDLLAGWFSDLGFSIEVMPVSDQPEKANMIACLGKGEGGLVLSGHTDTVPFDEAKWQQDPFLLTERDNRFYGLGTSDMKSFFSIVLLALEEMDLKQIRKPLFILATSDEESNMAGAKALVTAQRSLGRYALIGEPTGLKPIHAHKGVMFESIRIVGKSGHSSDPAKGINAMEAMNAVINGLIEWRKELQLRENNPAFKVPVPTLNFGSIHGGDNPNRICSSCELTIDVRLLPHMQIESVRESLRKNVLKSVHNSGVEVEFDCIFSGLPGIETDINAEIIKYAEKLAGESSGTVAFGTEAPYLHELGMQTVIMGAGDIEQAHQANEYLGAERIEPMKRIVQQMINHFCN